MELLIEELQNTLTIKTPDGNAQYKILDAEETKKMLYDIITNHVISENGTKIVVVYYDGSKEEVRLP